MNGTITKHANCAANVFHNEEKMFQDCYHFSKGEILILGDGLVTIIHGQQQYCPSYVTISTNQSKIYQSQSHELSMSESIRS